MLARTDTLSPNEIDEVLKNWNKFKKNFPTDALETAEKLVVDDHSIAFMMKEYNKTIPQIKSDIAVIDNLLTPLVTITFFAQRRIRFPVTEKNNKIQRFINDLEEQEKKIIPAIVKLYKI